MNDLDVLIDELEQSSIMIWKNELKVFLDRSPKLISLIMKSMPNLISLYYQDAMSDLRIDAQYWPMQIEKIVNQIESKKDFLSIADSLYFELRANILELKNILKERNIIVGESNNA